MGLTFCPFMNDYSSMRNSKVLCQSTCALNLDGQCSFRIIAKKSSHIKAAKDDPEDQIPVVTFLNQ